MVSNQWVPLSFFVAMRMSHAGAPTSVLRSQGFPMTGAVQSWLVRAGSITPVISKISPTD